MTHLQAARRLRAGLALTLVAAGLTPGGAAAAAPGPCGGAPQIADVTGDGHHSNTDVVSAWFAESAGRLQAVVRVHIAVWEPIHDDSDAAGFAVLWTSGGGETRYVRAEAPRGAPVRFDFGTWTLAGGFMSAGATTGATTTGTGGTVTIDIPAGAATAPGAVLARPFVLTYDGMTGADAHWVDRAPGGVTPAGNEFGADVVAGSCAASGLPVTPGAPGTGSNTGTPGDAPGAPGTSRVPGTTAVVLQGPSAIRGGGPVRVTGHVAPARAGIPVVLTSSAGRPRTHTVVTRANGRYALTLPITETTRLRAVADGLGSQTLTVTVRSIVALAFRRLRDGRALVTGTVRPALPGHVLLLRANAITPSAMTSARRGRFRLLMRRPIPGRYQAVYIPSGARAERSTSKTGVIR